MGGQSSLSPPEFLQSLLVSASVLSHQPNNCHRGLFQNLLLFSHLEHFQKCPLTPRIKTQLLSPTGPCIADPAPSISYSGLQPVLPHLLSSVSSRPLHMLFPLPGKCHFLKKALFPSQPPPPAWVSSHDRPSHDRSTLSQLQSRTGLC